MPAAAQPVEAPELEGARVIHREAPAEEASRLRVEADALATRLEAARFEERDLLGELSRLDRERSVAAKRARAAALEAGEAEAAELAARQRAAHLEERLAGTRRRIGLVLQALHREGPRREWRRLVEGSGEGAGATAVASAAVLRQAELGRELELAAEAAERARADAERRREELAAAQVEQERALAELETRRRAREAGLVGLRRESGRLGAELSRAQAALQELLGGATTPPAPVVASPQPAPPARLVDLAGLRGRLPWPVDGGGRSAVLERFGEVVNPRYGTRTLQHGVVLDAPAGTPIRAVAPGRVVFRDWYKGFGLSLVIDHGHGFLSVSAHARELFVSPGDPVEAGQVVGAVGDTGSLEGPRLYFQLQRDGEPVDPLRWLR